MKCKHLFLAPELLSRLIFSQEGAGVYYVQGLLNHNPLRARPEEIIRQLFILSLAHQYRYPADRIRVEHPIQMGRTKKRADVVVLGTNGDVEVVAEIKQEIDEESFEQMKSYLMVSGASFGAVVSGVEYSCFRRDGSRLTELDDLPVFGGVEFESGRTPASHRRGASAGSLRSLLQIENIEKTDKSHVRVTIKGQSVNLSLVEWTTFRKMQKRCLEAGIVLEKEVRQSAWYPLAKEWLSSVPTPPSNEEYLETKIAAWVNGLPIGKEFFSTREIAAEVLGINFPSRRDCLLISRIMRSLGCGKAHGRVDGRLMNGYRRPQQVAEKESRSKYWAKLL